MKITVADYVRARVKHWESAGDISARTAARYHELLENQIAPHIGTKLLQKLRAQDIEEWHTTLRTSGRVKGGGGLAPRTIGHAHRVLGKALADAVRNEVVVKNVTTTQSAPKVDGDEMVIVKDVPAFYRKQTTAQSQSIRPGNDCTVHRDADRRGPCAALEARRPRQKSY